MSKKNRTPETAFDENVNIPSKKTKKKKKKDPTMMDLYKSIRGSWNGVNPVTRIVESKKKKKPKYPHKFDEE